MKQKLKFVFKIITIPSILSIELRIYLKMARALPIWKRHECIRYFHSRVSILVAEHQVWKWAACVESLSGISTICIGKVLDRICYIHWSPFHQIHSINKLWYNSSMLKLTAKLYHRFSTYRRTKIKMRWREIKFEIFSIMIALSLYSTNKVKNTNELLHIVNNDHIKSRSVSNSKMLFKSPANLKSQIIRIQMNPNSLHIELLWRRHT